MIQGRFQRTGERNESEQEKYYKILCFHTISS
jgi:hypothetical protein